MTRPRDKLPVTRHTLAPSRNITRWPELELELPREKCEQRVDTGHRHSGEQMWRGGSSGDADDDGDKEEVETAGGKLRRVQHSSWQR